MSDPMILVEITGSDDFGGFSVVRPVRWTRPASEIRAELLDAVEAAMVQLALHQAQVDSWIERSAPREPSEAPPGWVQRDVHGYPVDEFGRPAPMRPSPMIPETHG